MDEASLELAIGALERFAAFVETLTPAELDAVGELHDLATANDVDGFAAPPWVASDASLEYFIGFSGQLARADHQQSLAQMRSQLTALKAARGRARSVRWPP